MCTRGNTRTPPLLPQQFIEAIDSMQFSDAKEDRPLLPVLYRDAFENVLGVQRRCDYSRLGWTDEEAEQLARVTSHPDGLNTGTRGGDGSPHTSLLLPGLAPGHCERCLLAGRVAVPRRQCDQRGRYGGDRRVH